MNIKTHLLVILIVAIPINLFSQSRNKLKLDRINNIRIGTMLYRDSTVQRGVSTRIDWISNKWLGTQYFGVLLDYDYGIPYSEPKTFLSEGTEYNEYLQSALLLGPRPTLSQKKTLT